MVVKLFNKKNIVSDKNLNEIVENFVNESGNSEQFSNSN